MTTATSRSLSSSRALTTRCTSTSATWRWNSLEFLEYGLGEHFTEDQFYSEFGSDATYPQVTINGRHIGSLKETLHFFQRQEVL